MNEMKFKLNNKVEIIYGDDIYTCDVQDVKDGHLAVSIPIRDNQYLPLQKGERIDVLYYEGTCLYEFSSVVSARQRSNIPLLWIVIPKRVKKIQRRKYVRVSVLINVKWAVIPKEFLFNKENFSKLKFFEGTAVDLSGGGLRLIIKHKVEMNTDLIMVLPFNDSGMLVKGKVMRLDQDEMKNIICGINFVEVKASEQEKIIGYVFGVMREQMKKGLKEE
ncbi:flagellar brake protein [Clostridium sp. ZS2-4]|uniref:flagellar brake protein n=1 Tax=Clostridium sp. ZS2-4 TaxID=2987703 RepID=UPI00227A9092|nr:flagellar brake domain-containing protein [Clostridium sp. ZS2-4]MCY6354020.1 PilZ domain-containing protein [Clostridium sp. ZS2-4]